MIDNLSADFDMQCYTSVELQTLYLRYRYGNYKYIYCRNNEITCMKCEE